MPRPKPEFSEYEHLLDGLRYEKPIVFTINTTFKVFCDNGHEYCISIGDIKNKNRDPKECPFCKKDQKYSKDRIEYSFFETFGNKYHFEVKNKKEFYSRWGDKVIFGCKKCNQFEIEIKSLKYFENSCDGKVLTCQQCERVDRGIKNENQFKTYIEKIEFIQEKFALLEKIDYEILSDNLKQNILSQDKWNVIRYINTKADCEYQCKDCGYIKKCSPYNLFVAGGKGFGCPNCLQINNKKRIFNDIKVVCLENNIFPVDTNFYRDVKTKINFKCNDCGYIFSKKWKDKSYSFSCPNCKIIKSKTEIVFADYIQSLVTTQIERNDRKQINPLELDVYIPEEKKAFEFCGGIWHSTKYSKDIYRHREKQIKCGEKGIRLITVFEDEWTEKRDICESRIKNLLGNISNKYFARKGKVNQIDNSRALKFCEENHIQGKGQTNESYGFFMGEELLSVMTFSKPSVSKHAKDYDWELNRFCSKKDILVIGAANKMLKCFSEKHKAETLITFCDLRWGTGNVYEQMGFKFESRTRPNYYYIGEYTKWKRKHRFNFTKQRLISVFNEKDTTLTEEEIAEKNGLYKIYDCGHLKFKKQL